LARLEKRQDRDAGQNKTAVPAIARKKIVDQMAPCSTCK
jgi:hypothetical protein